MTPSNRVIQTRNYILQAMKKAEEDKMYVGWLSNQIEILLLRMILNLRADTIESGIK